MKSIVESALDRGFVSSGGANQHDFNSDIDAELEDLLKKLKTNIKIVGCGGAGCNTINRIMEDGISGADLIAINTDAQHLHSIHSPKKILIGKRATRGLGAGARPQLGEEAAREQEEELRQVLQDAHIVFISCGLGGGTGTGSAPYVAKLAKEMGALTVAFGTTPFKGEGRLRMDNAQYGLDKLRSVADTVILIPNDKLLEMAPRLSLNMAFKLSDEILTRAIKGLTEIMTKPGLVNLDFNDLKTIMRSAGVAMIGLGEFDGDPGEDRAALAVEDALSSPLLDVDISSASGMLLNVTGGPDMTLAEAERVATIVNDKVNGNARIIWGAAVDQSLSNTIRVMMVVTGVESEQIKGRTMTGKSDLGLDFVK